MLNPNNPDIPALIALNRLLGNDPKEFRYALEVFDDPKSYLNIKNKEYMLDQAEKDAKRLTAAGVQFTVLGDDAYPERLAGLEDQPPFLYVRSATPVKDLFNRSSYVSVIGTRDSSPYGVYATQKVVKGLSCFEGGEKSVVVSGFALGIDILAHRSALFEGLPTIAVLPTDIESVYPSKHKDYAKTLSGTPGCALVSCFAPGTTPDAWRFLFRNRIIAGLSDETILVESKAAGGGIATARLAYNYDRFVYAVPGRIDDIRSAGCNQLIDEGIAKIVTERNFLKKA